MLTDIFATRYADSRIWSDYSESAKRLVVQSFNLAKEVMPFYGADGKVIEPNKVRWTSVHDQISNELGLKSLSPTAYSYNQTHMGKQSTVSGVWPILTVIENWVFRAPTIGENPNEFVKARLSVVELVLRMKELDCNLDNSTLENRVAKMKADKSLTGWAQQFEVSMRTGNTSINTKVQESIDEINTRFRQSKSLFTTMAEPFRLAKTDWF